MRIWKYTLPTQDHVTLEVPAGARILCLQEQGAECQLWALVDETRAHERRFFRIHGTGNPLPDAADLGTYLGTYQLSQYARPLVFHVFEVTT